MGENKEKGSKNKGGEKKNDDGVNTIVLKFDMHCEGCAKKVRKSVMKFQGVESVKTECSTNKLVVTGKVDPVKIKESVEEKMKKKVELVSPKPNEDGAKEGGGKGGDEKKSDGKKTEEKKAEGKSDESKKAEGKSNENKKAEGKSDDKKSNGKSDDNKKAEGKSDDKKKSNGKSDENKKSDGKKKLENKEEKPKEPLVATVLLKTKVHCEGCAQKIKKIVSKCEGVQDVNVDLQKDLITTKGTMNMKDLLPYLNVKLKRTVELASSKKDESSGKDKKPDNSQEKPKEGGNKSANPKGSGDEKKEGDGEKKDGVGDKTKGGKDEKISNNNGAAGPSEDNNTKFEVNKMEHNSYGYDHGYSYTYDPRQQGEGYGHQVVEYWHGQEFSQPPQLFSDENPNACSIM